MATILAAILDDVTPYKPRLVELIIKGYTVSKCLNVAKTQGGGRRVPSTTFYLYHDVGGCELPCKPRATEDDHSLPFIQ